MRSRYWRVNEGDVTRKGHLRLVGELILVLRRYTPVCDGQSAIPLCAEVLVGCLTPHSRVNVERLLSPIYLIASTHLQHTLWCAFGNEQAIIPVLHDDRKPSPLEVKGEFIQLVVVTNVWLAMSQDRD